MESTSEQPRTLTDGALGPDRQLPDPSGKVGTIVQHTKGLVEDIQAWVELKIQLTRLEIDEKIKETKKQALFGTVAALVAFLMLVFALVALALGLGEWLGHPAWGFLAVAGLLGLIVAGLLLVLRVGSARKLKRSNPTDKQEAASTTLPAQTHP